MSLQSPLLDERGLQSPLLDERADAPPAAAADGPTPPPPSARALAGLKLLFLLSSLSVATWGRLAAIFYHDRGLSPLEIGLIEGLMPLVQAGCQPCWGLLADARGAKASSSSELIGRIRRRRARATRDLLCGGGARAGSIGAFRILKSGAMMNPSLDE